MATKSVLVVNTKTVRLTVDEMLNGGNYEITISDVTDVDGLHIAAGQNPKAFVGVGTFPEVSSVSYVNPNTIDVLFDKPMESTLLEVEGNYSIAGIPARTVATATAQPDGVTAR